MEEKKDTKEKLYITFRTKDEITEFVQLCCGYDDAIDIKLSKQTTDAKSIVGMLLLPLDEPLEILYESFDDQDDYQTFKEDILAKFEVSAEG